MKKNKAYSEQSTDLSHNHIPDIELIDLELDGNTNLKKEEIPTEENVEFQENTVPEENNDIENSVDDSSDKQDEGKSNNTKHKGIRSFLNIHVALIAVFIIFVVGIIWKFNNWGIFVDINEIESDHSIGYLDTLDQILPLKDADGNVIPTGKPENIVVFGNAPFADDRDSEDNLANLIAEATGANVYNCAIGESYLASQRPTFDYHRAPMDAYCFYWLVTLGVNAANIQYYSHSAEELGDATPSDAQEVFDILTSLDFNNVDVVAVMYDATDYLLGHEMYDDTNRTNITQFNGNLEAGIKMLQKNYPHIRIIVMSPTYAYAINEDGEYVSSDIQRYGQDVLSTYVIKQSESCAYREVSFIDNLYGTITEDNAKDYLIDNIHLNVEGRKLVAQRFVDALSRYSTD